MRRIDEYCNEPGQLHRVDGPAIEYADGRREWRLNGQQITRLAGVAKDAH